MDRSIGDMPTLPGGSERAWRGILQPGAFFGRYKVHRFLGRGGMGEVYEVEHELDGAHYAMKVLSSEIPQTPENIRRFEREAQVMARLQHPNVISVDYFDETDGKYWFRMELARGIEEGVVTLGDLAAKNGGRIGQGLLVCLFEQILDGLSCAHEKGVIHRDLKPGNILLAHSDDITGGIVPKISDFGLVRLVGQDWLLKKTLLSAQLSLGEKATEGATDSQGLSTQSLVGTYAYMSPEQKQRKEIDERSDIYAVGLMIYRLLTGYTNPGERIRNRDSTLHAFWQRIIDQSVREDPNDRFSSAIDMLTELQRGHRVLASLDGKASLQKCHVEFQAKHCYTANRYLEEAVMIFPNDPDVLAFKALMREQLGILHDLKSRMQDFRRRKKYDDALAVSEQFYAICIEDEDVNKFIEECPRLVTAEQSRLLIEEASRLLEAEAYEAASQAAQKALALDPENSRARQIHEEALTLLKKMQIQQTREQVSKGLHQVYSLLKQKRYAEALDTLKHTPCSDSNHPKVIALRNACQAGLKKIRQYWKRAEEARASSDYQQAMSLLNEVLRSVAPEDPDTIERLHRLKREVEELSTASTEMDHAWKNKSFNECLKAAQRLLAIQPEHAKAQQYKLACLDKIKAIQMYVEKAEEYYQNQQYDEAIDTYKQTKKHYYLGKRPAKNEAEIESQHSVYSPEYKDILDRVAAIQKAKTSMEQAIQRAKESLEAGDLIETRLALNDYFELQTNGQEGLLLQNQLESLHRRATMMRWMWRSAAFLAASIVIGIGLTYGAATLVVSHRMQKELEKSCAGLTFARLKETQKEAGLQLTALEPSRFARLFSVKQRWKCWKESLDLCGPAWEFYAQGEYEKGREELEKVSPTEFTPFIRRTFDTFVQDTNALCADVNDRLAEGKYEDSGDKCNTFLLDYPQHVHVLDLLQKTNRARELEGWIGDPNVDIKSLSDYLGVLIEISPDYPNRQEWEKQCIQRVESKYDFLGKPLPTGVNAIKTQRDLCDRALTDIGLFKQCHGYEGLYKKLMNRKENLEGLLASIGEDEDLRDKLAQANRSIDQRCWGKAKDILDTLDPTRKEVAQLKGVVAEKIMQLEDLVKQAEKQVERENWFEAQETLNEVWSLSNRDDTWDLLQKVNHLQTRINEFMQEENAETRTFVEAMDQKDHTQIEEFVLDRVGPNFDLTPVYAKWFPRLNRDAQDALVQKKIDTALNLLSKVLNHDEIIRDANDERLKEPLQNLSRTKEKAKERSNQALALTDKAQFSRSKEQYAEALWRVHQALEKNGECDSAEKLHDLLQRRQRVATQYWQDANVLCDANFYFEAGRSLNTAIQEFPDLRVLALSGDLDTKIKEARDAKENVLNRRMSVKEFYNKYPDFDEFPSDAVRRIKKDALQDLKDRLGDLSQDKKKIIVNARSSILQDDAEYQVLYKKYGSGMRVPPSSDTNIANPDWCRIVFPSGIDLTLYIEGHGLKASGTAFVRYQDKVSLSILKPSDPDCSRTQALRFEPWKVHRITIKPSCFKKKTAEVQVVRKGWLFKEYDLDAMANQMMREYQIDKSVAIKSLQAKLDQMKDTKDITSLQVPFCWQEEQFVNMTIEEGEGPP